MGSPASGESITNDAGEENLQAQFEKDLLIKNPEINQDQSKFARRAVVSAAAFGSLSQVLGSLAANAIDMQNAAGVGLNSMPKDKKPEPGSKAAQLSIFQDETLGYAFALPPQYKMAGSQTIEDGGQVLFFVDETNPVGRVTLIAQRTPLASLSDLQESFVPQGTLLNQDIRVKDALRPDGSVYIYEFKNDEARFLTLFSLRLRNPAEGGNWLITVSCQAPVREFALVAPAFRDIVKSFRPTYPESKASSAVTLEAARADDTFGDPVGESDVPDIILAMPWGGY